ncbi:antitoxin Xre/MbcA/ParS toxin-binding domain-containing protein [Brevibacterium sp.]|uniref:antitoxin Xre/MbcA/ParS toxin-binding domain-containing protein n=1 Tax=Brevibacterium sp. TaxID=1701 RepID=UPI0028119355|nr:antitoxin Xre/MbcA/ParS toxin-binding domain-containing protein [Brevibacterium sp.]
MARKAKSRKIPEPRIVNGEAHRAVEVTRAKDSGRFTVKRLAASGRILRRVSDSRSDSSQDGIKVRAYAVNDLLGEKAAAAATPGMKVSDALSWLESGAEPTSEESRKVVDLEYVITRARLLWADDETVSSWLYGNNSFLGGSRPIDVLETEGAAPVIEALDQESTGSFA